MRALVVAFGILTQAAAVNAATLQSIDHVGDVYEIRISSETKGPNFSSRDSSIMFEKVTAVTDGGIELQYDLPPSLPAAQRGPVWQLPARILLSVDGSVELVNRSEIEARNRAWLTAAGLTEANCGQWYFTWDAFKVECDAESVLAFVQPYVLHYGDLEVGKLHTEPGILHPVALTAGTATSGAVFKAQMMIDPDFIRKEQAESDVATAQITGSAAMNMEAALAAHIDDQITGSVSIVLTEDNAGQVVKRTAVTTISIVGTNGKVDDRQTATTVTRTLVSTSP